VILPEKQFERLLLYLRAMTLTSYRDLIVWQKGVVGIGLQLQRAAVSIPANVAEGWARGAGRAYPFHLRVALGSEAELQTELEICVRAGVLSKPVGTSLLMQTTEVGRMLQGLLSSVEPKQRGVTKPRLS
jgi:four helix bundle protein